MKYVVLSACLFICVATSTHAQEKHVFSLSKQDFLLDGKPFEIISGEMHPARIPRMYWQQRIRMAKAMGCNTIAVYIFWNYQESSPGVFDFTTDNHDIAAFIRLCKQEGLWVLLRPGPYVCAEWDFGGLPPYLLKIPDIKVRCMDSRYMAAATRYINRLAKEVVPLQCTNGGPILMVQVENEYGSYGNDKTYLETLRNLWLNNGINVPFYTSDGPTDFMLDAGNIDGAAIGLDSGGNDGDFATAKKHNPNVPAMSGETYPGWLTHWKEAWQRTDTAILPDVRYLLQHKRSFNLYVVHGGTNFGFTAGANAFTPTQYQPDVTSYDYDAPITEQGQPTPKYFALRKLISEYVNYKIPDVPPAVPTVEIPAFTMMPFTSVWQHLPAPVQSPQPVPMEAIGQKNGFILYRTKLIGHKSGKLTIAEPHDYALVFLNGVLIDSVYRDGGKWTINLPKTIGVKDPQLDILVEAMGHINFAQFMIDRKGITDRVTLNGMTLMDWQIYNLPMEDSFIKTLKAGEGAMHDGVFFKGSFTLDTVADTYLDVSNFKKGVVWVNGHNLGRLWYVGPQQHLYCPAGWLKKGTNDVVVFDLNLTTPTTIKGVKALD